jgi:hypothetical protein
MVRIQGPGKWDIPKIKEQRWKEYPLEMQRWPLP